MSDRTPKTKLEKLRIERDTKIVSCLSRELLRGDPPSEADRNHLIEEAEILTDNWAAAKNNNRPLELRTAL